jgi:hypothetical protein
MFIAPLPPLISRSVRSGMLNQGKLHRAPNGALECLKYGGYKHLAPTEHLRKSKDAIDHQLDAPRAG